MPGFSFWQKWLFGVGIAIAVFGVLITLTSGTALFNLFNQQINPAFWGSNPVEASASVFQQWVYGILGATLAGWGIFVIFIAQYPFLKKEKWSWNCLVAGLLTWFILDTFLSLTYRVYFNAIFNTVIFILAMLPVVLTRKEFKPSKR
jgi:hypothetical protein